MNTDLRPGAQTLQYAALDGRERLHEAPKASSDEAGPNNQLSAIEAAYASHGGMRRADEVVLSMRIGWEQPISVLAKWIVSHAMFTIEWHSEILIPVFQIDFPSRALRAGCKEIVAELDDVMDDWEMACWFATSNPWLGGLPPVDVLHASWRSVAEAARVARFIVRG